MVFEFSSTVDGEACGSLEIALVTEIACEAVRIVCSARGRFLKLGIRRREPAMDWMMKCRYACCALETLRLGHNLDRTCWLASLSAYLRRSVIWFVVKDNIWALGRLYKNGETREAMRSIEALTLTLTLMESM